MLKLVSGRMCKLRRNVNKRKKRMRGLGVCFGENEKYLKERDLNVAFKDLEKDYDRVIDIL